MYDKPFRMHYDYQGVSFASSDITKVIRGPKGKRGRVVDVFASVTTTTAGSTSTPKIQIGKLGTLTESLNWDIGIVTAPAGLAASAAAVNPFVGADAYSKVNPILAADTDVYFTLKAAVGTPAGVLDIQIVIDWDL